MNFNLKQLFMASMLVFLTACGSSGGSSNNTSPDAKIQSIASINWLKNEPDGHLSWQEANSWCTKQGYRLPTMSELISVWTANNGQISPTGFKKDTFYWASEMATDNNSSHQACAMDYDCSAPHSWTDNSFGHPKCVVISTTSKTFDKITVAHNSGVDFSEKNNTNDFKMQDGYAVPWSPTSVYATGEKWGSGVWYVNNVTDSTNTHIYIQELGNIDLSSVSSVDKTAWLPYGSKLKSLQIGYVYVVKTKDGYAKFKVQSVNVKDWSFIATYSYSKNGTF